MITQTKYKNYLYNVFGLIYIIFFYKIFSKKLKNAIPDMFQNGTF